MDRFQSMQVFIEIAERGSLTAAAKATGRSLPSVVRILATLEESLQVRLFNRTTRRIALTEEGRFYLAQCRKILADLRETELALGRHQTEPSGTIRLTAPMRFGEMHVAPAVASFLEQYPSTRVEFLLVDRVVDLLEEGIDLAVRIAHLADSTLVARSIASIRQVVCANPGLLQHWGEPQHPSQLSEMPCVHFSGLSATGEWVFDDAGKSLSVPIASRLECNQVGASVTACVEGTGFGRFLSYQVMPLVRAGKLVIILQDYEPLPMPLSLVYPHSRLLSSRVRALVDWLIESIPRGMNPPI
ncbi:MAG: LysR family transcriptional regulator [Candidatus Thiodiazotropha sp.]